MKTKDKKTRKAEKKQEKEKLKQKKSKHRKELKIDLDSYRTTDRLAMGHYHIQNPFRH
ncbi:MAG: hypothetical protein ACFE9C_05750 [Candidatus Hodarchaeota archaeon]